MFKSIVTIDGVTNVTEHASTEAAWLKAAGAFGEKWDEQIKNGQDIDAYRKWADEDDRILNTPASAEEWKLDFPDFKITLEVKPA